MKAINTEFKYYRAHNAEHLRVHKESLKQGTVEFAVQFALEAVRRVYSDLVDQEDDLHLRSRGFEDTKIVAGLDGERDALFTFAYQTIYYAQFLPIAEMAEAGTRLYFVAKTFTGTNSLNYESNTTNIDEFVTEMKKAERAADVATLHLTDIIDLLGQKNADFETAYYGRSQEIFARDTEDNMKTTRQKVDDAARAYFEAINALYQINELVTKDPEKKAALEAVIDGINTLLNQLQRNISRRGTDTPTEADPDNKPADGDTTDTPPATDDDSSDTGSTDDSGSTDGGDTSGGNDDDEEVVG